MVAARWIWDGKYRLNRLALPIDEPCHASKTRRVAEIQILSSCGPEPVLVRSRILLVVTARNETDDLYLPFAIENGPICSSCATSRITWFSCLVRSPLHTPRAPTTDQSTSVCAQPTTSAGRRSCHYMYLLLHELLLVLSICASMHKQRAASTRNALPEVLRSRLNLCISDFSLQLALGCPHFDLSQSDSG